MNYSFSMRTALETGILDVWKKTNVSSMDRCKLKHKDGDRKPAPITLVQLSSAFVVLGMGIALTFLSFLIEMIILLFCKQNIFSIIMCISY